MTHIEYIYVIKEHIKKGVQGTKRHCRATRFSQDFSSPLLGAKKSPYAASKHQEWTWKRATNCFQCVQFLTLQCIVKRATNLKERIGCSSDPEHDAPPQAKAGYCSSLCNIGATDHRFSHTFCCDRPGYIVKEHSLLLFACRLVPLQSSPFFSAVSLLFLGTFSRRSRLAELHQLSVPSEL